MDLSIQSNRSNEPFDLCAPKQQYRMRDLHKDGREDLLMYIIV